MEIYQDRYTYLDNLRIILVYFVVFVHTICMFAYPLAYWWPVVDKSGLCRLYGHLILALDVFMMPHLIFLAAFFIFFSLKNKTNSEYIRKRFFRLCVPIIVFTFCAGDIFYQILFKRLGSPNQTYLPTFLDFWRDFMDFGAITVIGEGKKLNQVSFNMCHTWFLSVLFVMTLLVMPFRKKENPQIEIDGKKKIIAKTIGASMILAFFYVLIAIIFISNDIDFDSWLRVFGLVQVRLDQFFMLLPLFLFGLYMYRKEWLTKGDIGGWRMWGMLSAVLIFAYVLLFNNRIFPTLDEMLMISEHNSMFSDEISLPVISDSFKHAYLFVLILKMPICISLLMFFLSFARRFFNRPNRITAFCSKHSINVYILHFIPVLVLQYSFVNIPVTPMIKTISIFIIVISACLWISYRFVSPYPQAAVAFFVILKIVALFAGFDFYYIALLAIILISFAGALYESIRLAMPVRKSRQSA